MRSDHPRRAPLHAAFRCCAGTKRSVRDNVSRLYQQPKQTQKTPSFLATTAFLRCIKRSK